VRDADFPRPDHLHRGVFVVAAAAARHDLKELIGMMDTNCNRITSW
jgi:hypothetical protein